MSYISLSDRDKKEMLKTIGVSSIDELFHSIPESLKIKQALDIPPPQTEVELLHHFSEISKKNTFQEYLSFLGAGAYSHVIPSVVDYLSSRGEFISPYTPYQPEVSQGTLQMTFEFQTLICQLTGMDIANASLYDGASGAAEAVLMAHRLKGKSKVLLAKTLHPQYQQVIKTYSKNLDFTESEIAYSGNGELDIKDLRSKLDEETFAVVVQSPNFFGIIEKLEEVAELVHDKQALFIVAVSEPVSLGIVEAPGHLGADIVTGEAQSFGIPLSFGGPYLGFMACGRDFVRQFPGRISGETKDVEGKRGYVLTLSTREQHIRRERATSNICTNQAWCALRATIFLEALGKKGLMELARQNLQKAHYALEKLEEVPGVKLKFKGNFFNEFVLEFDKPWPGIEQHLRKKGIIGGHDLKRTFPELSNCALFCVTELHSRKNIDQLVSMLDAGLR